MRRGAVAGGGSVADGELILPPTTFASGRCSLCWESFRIGDTYRTIWPKRGKLAIQVHPACYVQLDRGDLRRIFAALECELALPIRVLFGRRVRTARVSGEHEMLPSQSALTREIPTS